MTTSGPIRCLILACGNPLRGDDGFGPWLAAWCQEQYQDHPEIHVIYRQQWTPELADEIARSQSVIFIDASTTAGPGELQLNPVMPEEDMAALATHHLNPSQLLALSQELFDHQPRNSFLLTMGIGSTDLDEKFSEPVRASLEKACKMLEDLVSRLNGSTVGQK